MNHRGSRFPPSGHRPHTALALKWLIASAPPEGRAPINSRAHLGTVRPSALSCRLPLPLRLASPPRLAYLVISPPQISSGTSSGVDLRDEPWRAHGASRAPAPADLSRSPSRGVLRLCLCGKPVLNSHPTVPPAPGRYENPRWCVSRRRRCETPRSPTTPEGGMILISSSRALCR